MVITDQPCSTEIVGLLKLLTAVHVSTSCLDSTATLSISVTKRDFVTFSHTRQFCWRRQMIGRTLAFHYSKCSVTSKVSIFSDTHGVVSSVFAATTSEAATTSNPETTFKGELDLLISRLQRRLKLTFRTSNYNRVIVIVIILDQPASMKVAGL